MRQTPSSQQQSTSDMVTLDMVGGSTFGRYEKISSAVTYNMFTSTDGTGKENWLINFAGYKRLLNLSEDGKGRGLFRSVRGGFLIAVVGNTVFRLSTDFVKTVIGTIGTSEGRVSIAENLSNQICIVDGLNAYVYGYASPAYFEVQDFSDDSRWTGLKPNYVSYHNTFFDFGNNNFTNDGAAWYAGSANPAYPGVGEEPLVYTSQLALQTKPDFALAVVRLPGQANNVLVLGETVCEIWTQVGGIQNYRRNSTLNVDYGCVSVSTIAVSDQFVCWLATNEDNAPVIMVCGQGQAQPISTDGIDYKLSQVQFPEQSTGMFYRQDGHLFYQLTFFNPKDNFTLVYDFNTKLFFNLTDQHFNYHPAQDYVYFNNRLYFLSINNGAIYESSTNYVTYDENIGRLKDPALIADIERLRVPSSIRAPDSRRFIANLLTLTLEQGCDPNVTQLDIDSYDIPLITETNLDPKTNPVPSEDLIITEWGDLIVDEKSWKGSSVRNNPVYRPRVDVALSRDGGVTWSNYVGRYLNPIGRRRNQLTWNQLGISNDLTIKFKFWGASRFVVNAAVLEMWS